MLFGSNFPPVSELDVKLEYDAVISLASNQKTREKQQRDMTKRKAEFPPPPVQRPDRGAPETARRPPGDRLEAARRRLGDGLEAARRRHGGGPEETGRLPAGGREAAVRPRPRSFPTDDASSCVAVVDF